MVYFGELQNKHCTPRRVKILKCNHQSKNQFRNIQGLIITICVKINSQLNL